MNQAVNQFSSPFFNCFSRTFLHFLFMPFFSAFPLPSPYSLWFFFFPSDSQTISNGRWTSDCSISPGLLKNLLIQGISSTKFRTFSLCLLKVPDAGKTHLWVLKSKLPGKHLCLCLTEEAVKCTITLSFRYFTLTGWVLHGLISRSQLPKMSLFMQFYTVVKTKS